MSYNEPFGVNTCFCLLGWGKCCALFPAVLNILLELIPSSTNRLTSDQRREEDRITTGLSDLQECQERLFAHLTDLPVVT